MEQSPSVALKLANTLEDLELVGAVLAGVADSAGLDALERSDMQTAVMEACKNVVWHAYEGVRGPLELEVGLASGLIEVSVRDHGIGIRPHLGERTLPHTGIGMPIAHLLARRITYTNIAGGGTEVCMEFSMPAVEGVEAHVAPAVLERLATDGGEGSILLALAGRPLVSALPGPFLAALASRAGMTPVGVAEVNRLAVAIAAAGAGEEDGGDLTLHARPTPQGIEIGFWGLGERLERTLRDRAARDPADRGQVAAEVGPGGSPGESLLVRLRAGG